MKKRLQTSVFFWVCVGLLGLVAPAATASSSLIDVEFTDGNVTPKTGVAATGLTSSDVWNLYYGITAQGVPFSSGVLTGLKYVDGTPSGAGVAVTNAGGAGNNGASDDMYQGYLYPSPPGGDISVTVTNLSAGLYDFYLYGHGDQNNQNSVFQLFVGGTSIGSEATTNGAGYTSPVWQEGVQYVEFTNVNVLAGQTILVQVEPGASIYAALAGMQIQSVGATTPVVWAAGQSVFLTENTSAAVTLSGSSSDGGTLAYTVVSQPTNGTLSGTAPNLTYHPATNYTGSDSFTFEVNEGSVTSAVATVSIAVQPASSGSVSLIDVEFNAGGVSPKVGLAATGLASTDFWNWYNMCSSGAVLTSGVLTDLKFSDGSASGVGLAVTNATGAYANGASDLMYDYYVYAVGGNISLTITNLSAGLYDFYLYGHGDQNNQNSVFQLFVGGTSIGSEATTNGAGWISSVWQEGVQYVEFTNVAVAAGQTIAILVKPGASSYAPLCGLQIQSAGATTLVVSASSQSVFLTENTSAAVTLSGSSSDGGTLAYTVVSQPTNGTLSGTAPNLTYQPATNYTGSDSFTFEVNEGSVTSAVATVSVAVQPASSGSVSLIDVEFNAGGVSPKVGLAATGLASTDFWNWYNMCSSGAVLTSGVLTDLKFSDGSASRVGLAVTNATGAYANGASDLMYDYYVYAVGGNISLTITNLSAGLYDFYLYGHGNANNQNSVFQLFVGGESTGSSEATTNGAGWISSVWQEGVQYVEFTNVAVAAGQTIAILVKPGASSYAPLCGLQIQSAGATTLVVSASSQSVFLTENTSAAVTLSGSSSDGGTLAYTVASQPTNGTLSGTAPNLTYQPATNYTGSDSFTFEVNEGSVTSAVATVSIAVQPASSGSVSLIDVEFNAGGVSPKVGLAATGLASTDFWNWYNMCSSGAVLTSGVLTDLKFSDGSASRVGLAVTNATGAYANGASDLMYDYYVYAVGGNISLTITNLSAGLYDFYLYGHGNANNQNSAFQLFVGGVSTGSSEATTNGAGWISSVWQEGVQYVEFTNVAVAAGQTIAILVKPGASSYAPLCGLQIQGTPTTGAPVVVQSPTSQTSNSGATVSFSASAGGSPSTIQWYLTNSLGVNPVAGGTSSPLVLTANDGTAGGYMAVFSNSFGMATTAVAVLTVIDPPVIATSPASQTANAGDQVTLTASITGGPASVQWYLINYLGTNAVAGATSPALTVTASGPTAGSYFAVFSNTLGSATTSAANLAVLGLPLMNGSFEIITNHAAIPVTGQSDTTVNVGDTWLVGWTPGGPGHDIFLVNGDSSLLDPYEGQQYIDFNGNGSPPGGSLSQTITTTVGQEYTVTFEVGEYGSGPQSLTAEAYGSNNMLLASNYCVPASDKWTQFQLDFAAVSSNTTLFFKDTSTTTSTADLTLDAVAVLSAPVVVTSPASQTVTNGNTVTFTASAGGTPSTVQWFQGTNLISGATNTTLTFVANAASGGNYTAVFTNPAGSATTTPALLTVDNPVFLTQQPQSLTTNVGATVTLAGAAGGDAPIAFQWQFDGANIADATNANLVLTNVQLADAGSYVLLATNASGWAASSNAVLSIFSTMQVAGASVAGAGAVTIPVTLFATGNESAMTFSLDFDPSVLTYVSLTAGSGTFLVTLNTAQAASGQIGLLVASEGDTYSPGPQEIVDVTFTARVSTNSLLTAIGFGGSPAPLAISDANGNLLAGVVYLAGTVTVTPTSLEGDVSPRPNGDHVIGANDWLQEGRFVAHLDTVSNASEFQRADCAPRTNSGDGVIDSADLAQVGRYAVGLDPLTPVGWTGAGPQLKAAKTKMGRALDSASDRTLSLVPMKNVANAALVQLLSQGDENTLAFSVSFDPALVRFTGATQGAGTTGAQFRVNTNALAAGSVGIVLALPGGQAFAAGTNPVAQLAFSSVSYSNTVALSFGDAPVPRSMADVLASPISTAFQSGTLAVGGTSWPVLDIVPSGSQITLSWPSSATNFLVQTTTNFSSAWTAAGGAPVSNGAAITLTLPAPAATTFYRLSQQP